MLALASAAALALLIAPSFARAEKSGAKKSAPVIAHVKLSGVMSENAPPDSDPLLGAVDVETFKTKIDRLKKAASDKEVTAVLLEIDGLSVGWGKIHEL